MASASESEVKQEDFATSSTLASPSRRWALPESVGSSESTDVSVKALDQPLLPVRDLERVQHRTSVWRCVYAGSLFALVLVLGLLAASHGAPKAPAPPSTAAPKLRRIRPRIWNPDLPSEYDNEPAAKGVIRRFDAYNMARGGRDDGPTFNANVDLYMDPALLYESVGFGTWHGPHGWSQGEEVGYGNAFPQTLFTQMLFFGDKEVATTTTYGSALWKGDLFGIKGPNQWVTLRIVDFYDVPKDKHGHHRIRYNFMMIDWVDALRQIGRPVLPPAALEEGLVLPPAANDGVPAPLTVLIQAEHRDSGLARRLVQEALREDWAGNSPASRRWAEDMSFYGPGGVGLARGVESYEEHVLTPFRKAFANRSVEELFSCCEGNYCGVLSKIHAVGVEDWLGLPTTGKAVSIRTAMHWRTQGSRVQEGWAIIDFPGLFEQVGLNFYDVAKGHSSLASAPAQRGRWHT